LLLALVLSGGSGGGLSTATTSPPSPRAPAHHPPWQTNKSHRKQNWFSYKATATGLLEMRARDMQQVTCTAPVIRFEQGDLRL